MLHSAPMGHGKLPLCAENLVRVDDVTEAGGMIGLSVAAAADPAVRPSALEQQLPQPSSSASCSRAGISRARASLRPEATAAGVALTPGVLRCHARDLNEPDHPRPTAQMGHQGTQQTLADDPVGIALVYIRDLHNQVISASES